MRRKKLFGVTLIFLGLGTGVFFIRRSPSEPLVVRITGVTNYDDSAMNIYCVVSNRTSQPYQLLTTPETLSNGVWVSSGDGRELNRQTTSVVFSRTNFEDVIYTYRRSTVRLRIDYLLFKTPRQNRIDDFFHQFGAKGPYDSEGWDQLNTPPFELRPR